MSIRREVKKLTHSTRWARIQGKFQDKAIQNESVTLSDVCRKGSLQQPKDFGGISYKDNENGITKDSKGMIAKENASANDSHCFHSLSKQTGAAIKVNIPANSSEELCVENKLKIEDTSINTKNNLSDSEVAGNKQTFVTKTFSEITNESLRSLFRNQSSANKSEVAVLQTGEDSKNDSCTTTHNKKLVKALDNDVSEKQDFSNTALQIQTNNTIKEPQLTSTPCHKGTISKLQCFSVTSQSEKLFEDEIVKYILSEDFLQKNLPSTRKNITTIMPLHVSRIERRRTFKHNCRLKTSFRERRKYLRPQIKVKNLIHKFEKVLNDSFQETQDNDSCDNSFEEQHNAPLDTQPMNECCANCGKLKMSRMKGFKNRDDSGISEGEESISKKHINQTINHRLIESCNRHLNKINAGNNANQDCLIKNVDYVPKHIYGNLCTRRICRESRCPRSKSPRLNLIIKKPMPLPRSCQSQPYSHISDCYSGYRYQQKDPPKRKTESTCSKSSQSEEEWADISEEEKEVISYSQKLAKVSKRFYDLKLPVHCSEAVNSYDCCSPREKGDCKANGIKDDNCKANGIKDDNSTCDSSWETDEEEDGDKSSISSEHHYEAINDFLKNEPGDLSTHQNDEQSPGAFIKESFNFLDTHSADESDDVESSSPLSVYSPPPLQNNYKRLKSKDKLSPSFEFRNSIAESILMYQDMSVFRKSFNKKTFKSVLKENSLESNKLKIQSLFSKNSKEKLNFHVPWFSKCDQYQKLPSNENIPEQLGIDSPELKTKKKGKYFTMPNQKKWSRSEQHLDNLNSFNGASKNFNCERRASDSSPCSPDSKSVELNEGNQNKSLCHESSGNKNSMQSQSPSATDVSEMNRISVVSCSSCADEDYVCRKHLESKPTSSSSSEESVTCLHTSKPIDVNFVKIRQRVESTGSEHSYFQVTQISKPALLDDDNTSYEQVFINDQNNSNNNVGDNEQNNSELYCELNAGEFRRIPSPSEEHMSIEELSQLFDNGERKLWSDLPEVQKSGVLENMSAFELKLQEAMFNVAIFEATYLRLLETYQGHFVRSSNSGSHSLCRLISWHEWQLVFADSLPIIDLTKRLVAAIEQRWDESYFRFDITDILYENITSHFEHYVKYCYHKQHRERMLKVLMNTKPKFAEVTRHLEASSMCQGLLLHEILTLPEHHVSDLLIFTEKIFYWLPPNSSKYNIYKEIMDFLHKLKIKCEKGALQMERMEKMLLIAPQLTFKDCKPISLISASRWLLKRGEMTHLICDVSNKRNKRAFAKNFRWSKMSVYIFLFNDFLLVTKRRSDENYNVLDYCPKNIVQAKFINDVESESNMRPPTNYKNLVQLILWSNHKNKTVEMILNCPTESDKIRWGEALISDETTDSDLADKQDNSYVQCIQPYSAQQADELTLFESDVMKIHKKIGDGWCKGKHTKDENIGWFPSTCVTEINIHDFKLNHLSLGYKYSQASCTSSSKIPVSPK